MLAKVFSSALQGIDVYPVEVEVDLARGLPKFNIVGLPDAAAGSRNILIKTNW
jgi:magnesium chelatase family protein